MTPEQAKALREEFPPSAIGKLPKAGLKLDYVGHAGVTDRLLAVDPEWTWEPFALAIDGTPLWTSDGGDAVMWIRLTVAGVTRPGVGICKTDATDLEKQLISDALRNAAMRFGVALSLWSKEDLASGESAGAGEGSVSVGRGESPVPAPSDVRKAPALASRTSEPVTASPPPPAQADDAVTDPFVPPKSQLDTYHSRCTALAAGGVDIFAERKNAKLPPLSKIVEEAEWVAWGHLLADLETAADKQAVSA